VQVKVTDTLENAGDRTLNYLDVSLPTGPSFGTRNVTVSAEGKVVVSQQRMTQGGTLRIPFGSKWAQGERREITFSYDLQPAPEGRGVVAATPTGFYLAAAGVFPFWQKPVGPFAQGSLRAKTEELEITVPADFRVLALGHEQHSERHGAFVVHRFERRYADFSPYVVAGRYVEQRVETPQRVIFFWTREPLDTNIARQAARHLATTIAVYEDLFAPAARNRDPIYIVETSAQLAPIAEVSADIAAASFPNGVLFDQPAVALGLASDPVLNLADYELARTWFGWSVRPRTDADFLLGRGMALCASVLAAEATGGTALRRERIAEYLATFDRTGGADEERPGVGSAQGYTRAEIRAKSYKAALFLVSLEDMAGAGKFERALQRILKDMAGQEISSGELRSALEAETGQNLAPTFHEWLDHPGIPQKFRARYGGGR
jgi:hypothetical protein